MTWSISPTEVVTGIKHYEIYSFIEENPSVIPSPVLWKKVGEAMAIPLPIRCNVGEVNIFFKKI